MKSVSQVRCGWLAVSEIEAPTEATSCGLDLWHSEPALNWTGTYLRASPAVLRVTDGNSDASMVCQLRRLPGGVRLASVYPYGRIAGDVALFWQSLPAVSKTLRHKGVIRLEIPFSGPYLRQLDALPSGGRVRIPDSMQAVRHVLELTTTDPTELEQKLDPNIRWAVRKAKRNDCSVRIASTNDVDVLQDLYARTMRAKGAPVNYGPERWRGIASMLMPDNHGCLYIGEIEGKPHGMAAVVDGAVSRHLIQLAVPPDSHSSRLGELLVMTTLHDAQAKGLRYYDFMASNASDKGLVAFKAKWGAVAEPIKHVIIPGMPGMQHVIDVARWANRTRARFSAS